MKRWRTSRVATLLLALGGFCLAAQPPAGGAAHTAAPPAARAVCAAQRARGGADFNMMNAP
ncbi:MAG: hypothetical protein ABWY18_06945, partial [Tardiphaga sp.]